MTIDAAQRGRELFETDYYCAEAVLLALAEHHGIESDAVPQIATGFCSGIARSCGMCGAVTGAIMGIGLVRGRRDATGDREPCYAAVRSLLAGFETQFGSSNCQVLTGVDLDTAEGQAAFRANGTIADCTRFVEEAVRLALAALAETV